MERASKFIRGLGLPGDTLNMDEFVRAAWPVAVGKRLASHTRVAKMVRTKLVVEVEDVIWQRQLFALTGQILKNLVKSIGAGAVEDIEFRVVSRRRDPARATVSTEAAATPQLDEADGIADPVLRELYRASRKRALA